VGASVSPLAQTCLNETLGLAVGLRRVRLGADMLETEALAGSAEGEGFVARTVVGHHSLNLDAQAGIVSDSHLEEGDSASLFLVLHDLAERDPGGIVDADMDKLPSDSFAARAQIALASTIAGDAMADP